MAGSHTPGPWETREAPYGWDIFSDGRWVAYGTKTAAADGDIPIYPTKAESAANAHLIAASPSLLTDLAKAEAFIAGFEDDETQEGISGPDGLLARIRATIAKATGQ